MIGNNELRKSNGCGKNQYREGAVAERDQASHFGHPSRSLLHSEGLALFSKTLIPLWRLRVIGNHLEQDTFSGTFLQFNHRPMSSVRFQEIRLPDVLLQIF